MLLQHKRNNGMWLYTAGTEPVSFPMSDYVQQKRKLPSIPAKNRTINIRICVSVCNYRQKIALNEDIFMAWCLFLPKTIHNFQTIWDRIKDCVCAMWYRHNVEVQIGWLYVSILFVITLSKIHCGHYMAVTKLLLASHKMTGYRKN